METQAAIVAFESKVSANETLTDTTPVRCGRMDGLTRRLKRGNREINQSFFRILGGVLRAVSFTPRLLPDEDEEDFLLLELPPEDELDFLLLPPPPPPSLRTDDSLGLFEFSLGPPVEEFDLDLVEEDEDDFFIAGFESK